MGSKEKTYSKETYRNTGWEGAVRTERELEMETELRTGNNVVQFWQLA